VAVSGTSSNARLATTAVVVVALLLCLAFLLYAATTAQALVVKLPVAKVTRLSHAVVLRQVRRIQGLQAGKSR
jgi:hypothetical protein